VLREVQRKLASATAASLLSLHRLQVVMARDERIRTQQTKDKNKLYALHASEVECISKGNVRTRTNSA
jgi:IS5 family transposase